MLSVGSCSSGHTLAVRGPSRHCPRANLRHALRQRLFLLTQLGRCARELLLLHRELRHGGLVSGQLFARRVERGLNVGHAPGELLRLYGALGGIPADYMTKEAEAYRTGDPTAPPAPSDSVNLWNWLSGGVQESPRAVQWRRCDAAAWACAVLRRHFGPDARPDVRRSGRCRPDIGAL